MFYGMERLAPPKQATWRANGFLSLATSSVYLEALDSCLSLLSLGFQSFPRGYNDTHPHSSLTWEHQTLQSIPRGYNDTYPHSAHTWELDRRRKRCRHKTFSRMSNKKRVEEKAYIMTEGCRHWWQQWTGMFTRQDSFASLILQRERRNPGEHGKFCQFCIWSQLQLLTHTYIAHQ